MFSKDRWKEIIQVLTTNWFRTILTAFGVFWGIFILILLLSAGKGLENGIKKNFGGLAVNTMSVWTRSTTKSYKGLPKGRRFFFKIDDVQAIRENFPQLKYISPRASMGTANVEHGIKADGFEVMGDYPEISEQDVMEITRGRFINYGDINEKRKVAVVGEGVVEGLYDVGEKVIGSYVKIYGVSFMVVGTYKKKAEGGNEEEARKQIYLPFSSFAQAFNRGDSVDWMLFTAQDEIPITGLKESILTLLKEKRKVHPEDLRAIGYNDVYENFSRVEGLFGAMRLIGYFVGILVLLSGVIGVSNIMLIVVKERTKEIGIRRALGESPFSIKFQILMESVFLTIISGMCGIILGALLIYVINAVLDQSDPVDMFANPSVDIGIVSIALLILMVSGLLAGFIPAQSAIKVRPIEALRNE